MKKHTLKFHWIPEFYFILVSIFWYYLGFEPSADGTQQVNFPALLLIIAFHIQLFLNDETAGKVLSILVTVLSIAVTLVLYLQVPEETGYGETFSLALKAIGLMLLNGVMAYMMFRKYSMRQSLQISGSEQ